MVNPVIGKKHFTIPVFIPHEACLFQCIFCDQKSITGKVAAPSSEEIDALICRNLATFSDGAEVETGFFGGTFTGLPLEIQKRYFEIVLPYIDKGKISSIRLSTRPDFIDEEKLEFLKKYPVKTIELGVQSFDDEVLRLSARGHTAEDSGRASKMVLNAGFSLGLQMMTGLPGDTLEKTVRTAKMIAALKAAETRIYPVLIIKNTHLEKMYQSGKYVPLDLEEAIKRTAAAVEVFEEYDVKIIRIGLHHSDSLMENGFVAGPAHPSFRELVMTEIWNKRLSSIIEKKNGKERLIVKVNPEEINAAVGYYGRNRDFLKQYFREVKFRADSSVPLRSFHADHS